MTESMLQGMKPQNLVAERDFKFGMQPKEDSSPMKNTPEKEKVVEVQTKLLPVCLLGHLFEGLWRLTTDLATTSLRNPRDSLAPQYYISQDSNKCPRARSPYPRPAKSRQLSRCRT